jgi:uncharacterized Zn finger protein
MSRSGSSFEPRLGAGVVHAPEDAIASSTHPMGAVGSRWASVLDRVPSDARDRVLRGRNVARRGRARGLEVSPGGASIEVHAEDVFRPSLVVRPFEPSEWDRFLNALRADLASLAHLLEGELPLPLLEALGREGLAVLPSLSELTFDCDCGDFVMPCAHAAVLHHLLADAIDHDPFQLLTLRGRARDALLDDLRGTWGDAGPLHDGNRTEESLPDGAWSTAAGPLPDFACSVENRTMAGAGMRALGPPPGATDLLGALVPLYEAGSAAARALLESSVDRVVPERRRAPSVTLPPLPATPSPEVDVPSLEPSSVDQAAGGPAEASREDVHTPGGDAAQGLSSNTVTVPAASDPATDGDVWTPGPTAASPHPDITERLVDHLAIEDGSTADAISRALGIRKDAVREELLALERLGIVFRSEAPGGVGWHVG